MGRPPLAGGYRCLEANQRACRLRRTPRVSRRMVMGTPLWDSVLHGLSQGLSPEQVSGLLSKRMDNNQRISHESIYSAIYAMPRGELRSQEHLDAVAWRLNTCPRKSLAWMCPAELFLPEGSFDAVAYWKSILNSSQPSVALLP